LKQLTSLPGLHQESEHCHP